MNATTTAAASRRAVSPGDRAVPALLSRQMRLSQINEAAGKA